MEARMKSVILYFQALLLAVPFATGAFTNIALNKPAWQSSTYHDYNPAGKAVDGNKNTNYMDRSCTHTHEDQNAWWAVDLGMEYQVAEVWITNRGDCCEQRLSDFTIAVGNTFDPDNFDSTSFEECIRVSDHLGTGETKRLECREGLQGRYVTIYLNNRNYLTLCEVEVYKDRKPVLGNLALHRATWQSSTYHHWYDPSSSKAVDGDKTSYWGGRSCACTNEETSPWWVVDLAAEYPVSELVITNRGDCCAERLSDFSVSVGRTFDPFNFDPSSFTKCAYVHEQLGSGETRTIQCHEPVVGRYVTVFLNGRNYLTLCEVEVHRANPADKK